MAGHWTTDTSGSDTETEEESLTEGRIVTTFGTFGQDEMINVGVAEFAREPHEDEIIVLSSDGESLSRSSNERFSSSYASSSSSMTSEHSDTPPLFNMTLQALDHQFFFRDFGPRIAQLSALPEQSTFNSTSNTAEESSQDDLNSPTDADIQEAIKRRLPTVSELAPIEVRLSSNRRILADFPKLKDISGSSIIKEKIERLVPNEDSSAIKKSSKYNPDFLPSVPLKRYQVSSISEAIWKPLIRKAQVTYRRGKQLESMGSSGNPTYLEFYEALYLMTRAKLYLLSPEMTPMSVFDAHNSLIRNSDDFELYSIYEHFIDSNAIVVPFKPLKVEIGTLGVSSRRSEVVEEPRNIQVSVSYAQPSLAIPTFSAYEKEDSDSDLEVLSCNMPVTSKSVEVVYGYEQSAPYEGPEISFPELDVSMQSTALQVIPQELLPECRMTDTQASNPKLRMRIPVEGGEVCLQSYWFTPEGMESSEQIEFSPEGQKRSRKRKKPQRPRLSLDRMRSTYCPLQIEDPLKDRTPDRYHRRWFPRWFDGIELGVHSMSIVDTLHKFTDAGIPKIEQAGCWTEYKNAFAKLVQGSLNLGKDNSLFRGEITPLMTGTKGNQTQLIFGELLLTREISEPSDLRERIQNGNKRLADDVKDESCLAGVDVNGTTSSRRCPKIIFDVYIDSAYSKNKPTTPDYRVVHCTANSVLKITDLLKLTLEAGDATLLVAHFVDGRVRVRQAVTFSIPRYS